jgi:Ca2+/Na+ antiporter
MDFALLGQAILAVIFASIVIMYACNEFEDCADHLGKNMKPGIKGATINAIGSSLPEMLTTFFLLFMFNDMAGFSAGIATTAGSAIFNSVVIPLLCIAAVKYYGVRQLDGSLKKVDKISIEKKSLLRDVTFLLIAEGILIYFLGNTTLTWVAGVSMLGFYLFYLSYLLVSTRGYTNHALNDEENNEDESSDVLPSKFKCLITFQFNNLFFKGQPLNTSRAWVNLIFAVIVIGAACHLLAESVMWSSEALDIPAYFTALIFAAAATSVPDAILSVKDAIKGNYDDAISNAIGSNTFDITVALGLPLLVYTLFFGDVNLISSGSTNEDMQVLRYVLIGVTLAVALTFLLPKFITAKHIAVLGFLYAGWMGYVLTSATSSTSAVEITAKCQELKEIKVSEFKNNPKIICNNSKKH